MFISISSRMSRSRARPRRPSLNFRLKTRASVFPKKSSAPSLRNSPRPTRPPRATTAAPDWVWRFLRASQNSWAEKWASSAESALGQRSGSPCLCPSTTPILSNPIPRSSSVRFASFMWMTTPPIASSCASSSIIGTCATRLALRRWMSLNVPRPSPDNKIF